MTPNNMATQNQSDSNASQQTIKNKSLNEIELITCALRSIVDNMEACYEGQLAYTLDNLQNHTQKLQKIVNDGVVEFKSSMDNLNSFTREC